MENIFVRELVFLRQHPGDKNTLLRFLAEQMSAAPSLKGCRADDLEQALLAREAKGSTAVGDGIAIPHCGVPGAQGFAVAVVTVEQGLAFDAFDQQPCRLFFCIIGPENDRNQHVRLLSTLTVGLSKPNALQRLLACQDGQSCVELLLELMELQDERTVAAPASTPAPAGATTGLLRVDLFCQRERYFRPLLEEVAAGSICAPVVIEANNAGGYLRNIPLYASLWGDDKPNRFLRVVIGVMKVDAYDKLLRSVQRITAKRKGRGVLLIRQSLDASYGSIDY